MLVAVYKSTKRKDTFLYVSQRDHFDDVPKPLLEMFGTPKFVILVDISNKNSVANLPTEEFVKEFKEKGFYLQMPPVEQDLLAEHRKALGLTETPDIKF
ncbi:YcgL domain-containing protein [Glaciecola sp. 1036]|uniref:YcgL domain-containing protein n=1 Tax=Alteromonadaceae TaxID=72275 RepID=UPI003D01B5C8